MVILKKLESDTELQHQKVSHIRPSLILTKIGGESKKVYSNWQDSTIITL